MMNFTMCGIDVDLPDDKGSVSANQAPGAFNGTSGAMKSSYLKK